MTDLVEIVRNRVKNGCIAKRCKKDGCSVSLKCVPKQHLIIDFDKPGSPFSQTEKRCDYLFVAKEPAGLNWLVLLELKKNKVDAKEVVEQLRAGVDKTHKFVPGNIKFKFRPVVAHRGIHKAEMDELRKPKNKISFLNYRESVRLIDCGDKLNKELSGCFEKRQV